MSRGSRRRVRRACVRTALILGLLVPAGCDGCSEPERTARVDGLTVDVPDDWTVELEREAPMEQLALRPSRPTVLCRVVVMRGKGEEPAPTPQDFIDRSRQRFGGTEQADMSLDSGIGRIEGKSLHEVRMPEDLKEMGDDARVEVYATEHDGAMVGAVIGWFFGEKEDQRLRDDCFDALETLRPSA